MTAKISSGRLVTSVVQAADGSAVAAVGSEPAGQFVVDLVAADARRRHDAEHGQHPISQNTTTGPNDQASRAAMPAAVALPAWLKASLRPILGANSFGPISPRVTAAIAGAKTAAASEATDWLIAISANPLTKGRITRARR